MQCCSPTWHIVSAIGLSCSNKFNHCTLYIVVFLPVVLSLPMWESYCFVFQGFVGMLAWLHRWRRLRICPYKLQASSAPVPRHLLLLRLKLQSPPTQDLWLPDSTRHATPGARPLSHLVFLTGTPSGAPWNHHPDSPPPTQTFCIHLSTYTATGLPWSLFPTSPHITPISYHHCNIMNKQLLELWKCPNL